MKKSVKSSFAELRNAAGDKKIRKIEMHRHRHSIECVYLKMHQT
jgi:hypothetical protein